MAKMVFMVSDNEFKEKVNHLCRQCRHLPKMSQEPVDVVAGFFEEFMVNLYNEDFLGCYDYELRVGDHSISLDDPDGREELRRLVGKALVL